LLALAACLAPARAGTLTITPTYQSSVPQAAQDAFNEVVALFESTYETPFGNVNVPIDVAFGSIGNDLGESDTNEVDETYHSSNRFVQGWVNQMDAAAAAEVNNPYLTAAVATLPTTNPLGGQVVLQDALASVLGFTNVGNPLYDSTLTFTNAANTFEYTGTATGGEFDFMNVAEHELDEALGIGSALTGIADNGALPTNYEAEDFFRYSAPGVRDVTTAPTANVYFSYNGGTTNVAQFNQVNADGDRNDWIYADPTSSNPNGWPAESPRPFIQDADGCSGVALQYGAAGSPEETVLQTLGYELAAPEPGTICLLGAGLIGLALMRRWYSKA
jgi:hypothetical protein